jgi:hypothetical protein
MNLRDAERRAYAGKATLDELDALVAKYWQEARETDDFRRRGKLLKKACHFAGLAFDAGMKAPERLAEYEAVFEQALTHHSFPGEHRAKKAKITRRRLEKLNIRDAKIVTQTKGWVGTEAATLAIGDPDSFDPREAASHEVLLRLAHEGKWFAVSTGYDGKFYGYIRLVDGKEPVISQKEYKRVASSSKTVLLRVASGRVALGEGFCRPFDDDGDSEDHIFLEVPPGTFRVQLFGFHQTDYDKVVAVLAREEDHSIENGHVTEIDGLFD